MNKAMKNSGIEWIGEVPENWQVSKCGNFFEIVLGKMLQPTRANSSDTFESYLSAINFGNNTLKYEPIKHMWFSESDKATLNINNGDLLVVEGGDVASSDIARNAPSGLHFQNSLMRVRVINTEHDIRFLRYWLMSAKSAGYVELICNKATIVHFPKNKLINFPYVYIESISEQKNIVDSLDYRCAKIDRLISLQQEMIMELQAYKQSVITEVVTKGLDPDVPMKDSGVDYFGIIPSSWSVARLKDILLAGNDNMRAGPFGSALRGDDFKNEGYWVYNQRTVIDYNFDSNDSFINENKYHELKSFRVSAGDVLITTRGSIGRVCKVPDDFNLGVIHPCIIRFRIDENKIKYKLLELIFNHTMLVKEQVNRLSNSTTIDVIYAYNLKNVYLPLIPKQEQMQLLLYLEKRINLVDALIKNKKTKIETLKEYKKSLIYECVTGKRDCTMWRQGNGA